MISGNEKSRFLKKIIIDIEGAFKKVYRLLNPVS
jgi:hypothetical protein